MQASDQNTVYLTAANITPTEADITLVSSGTAALRFLLGNEAAQSRLFRDSINWNRVILARQEGRPVAYLTFCMDGTGPYSPRLRSFVHEFGLVSGVCRYAAFGIFLGRCAMPECYVYKMYVVGEKRGLGIGSMLMERLIDHAWKAGKKSIALEVFEKNQRGINFYKRLGFFEAGKIKFGLLASSLPDANVIKMKVRLGCENRCVATKEKN